MEFSFWLRVCTFALLSLGLSTTFAVVQGKGYGHERRDRDDDSDHDGDHGNGHHYEHQRASVSADIPGGLGVKAFDRGVR